MNCLRMHGIKEDIMDKLESSRNLMKWLSVTNRFTGMALDKELAEIGLNSSQHFFVIKICEEPGITQDKLQALVYLNPSNITRGIAQLAKKGFVTKETNSRDKRTSCLYPTEKAKACYQKIKTIQKNWLKILTENFTDEESALLCTLVERTAQNALDFFNDEQA